MNTKHIILAVLMEIVKDEKGNAYWRSLTSRQQNALKNRLEKAVAGAVTPAEVKP